MGDTSTALAKWLTPLVVVCALCSTGCASYLSTQSSGTSTPRAGLVYYLPRRPIIVQVVVTQGPKKTKVETPSLVTAAAIPDQSARYVLDDSTNLISENNVTLGVSPTGLLQTSDSTVTSGLSAILANLATTAGTRTGFVPLTTPVITTSAPLPPDHCKVGQTYNLLMWPDKVTPPTRLCEFTVTLQALDNTSSTPAAIPDASAAKSKHKPKPLCVPPNSPTHSAGAGIYYRIELPYQVTVTLTGRSPPASVSYIATSPDCSPRAFLPIKRTLFANNTVKLSMKDGEVTNFEQDDIGELVGLSSIPASVISAYFTAISNIVPKRIGATNAQMALALSNLQLQRCQAAIAANPIDGKSETETDKDTALSNIKAACTAAAVPATGQ